MDGNSLFCALVRPCAARTMCQTGFHFDSENMIILHITHVFVLFAPLSGPRTEI